MNFVSAMEIFRVFGMVRHRRAVWRSPICARIEADIVWKCEWLFLQRRCCMCELSCLLLCICVVVITKSVECWALASVCVASNHSFLVPFRLFASTDVECAAAVAAAARRCASYKYGIYWPPQHNF